MMSCGGVGRSRVTHKYGVFISADEKHRKRERERNLN